MTAIERGLWGEKLALLYLNDKGYSMVQRNFRSRFGEIDLIVKNKDFIVFVEVKVRKNSNFAFAREFVSYKKQKKIQATANLWLSSRPTQLQPRFDVIEIYTGNNTGNNTDNSISKPEINHIENAF